MTGRRPTGLVVGASGVAGRHIAEELARRDWNVVSVARRPDDRLPGTRVSVDIRDREACARAFAPFRHATHVFFCARNDAGDAEQQTRENRAMLAHVLDAVERASPHLAHVQLMHGMKAYGNLLGPFATPALENDPRLIVPVPYYAQEDLVRARRAEGASWRWSTLRPGAICGITLGRSGNLVQILGAYGAICRELGVPLFYPGTRQGFAALRQVVDAKLFARAAVWVATHEACADQAFNVSNGDVFRWERLWPALAGFFGLEPGPPQPVKLKDAMKDKGPLWDAIVRRQDLVATPFEDIASWSYADVFHNGWDAFASDVRLRATGFAEVVATEDALLAALGRLQALRLIP